MPEKAIIGTGVRAEPDLIAARLLDRAGIELAKGVLIQRQVEAGSYFLLVESPPDSRAIKLRPALVGVAKPDSGPPPDVRQSYLELVGLAPPSAP